jgi:ATP-binding cassette, subfamily B, bacterial
MQASKEKSSNLPKTIFPFIWHFLRDYKPVVAVFVFLTISAGFWGPFNSLIIKHIINLLPEVREGDVSILLIPATLVFVNFIIFDNFTWRGVSYIRAKFSPVIINNIMQSMMDDVLKKSHQFFQDNLSGKIAKQITNLADGIERLINGIACNFLRGASLLLTSFVAAYLTNPIFSIILIVWFVIFSSVSILMSKKLIALSDKQAEMESKVVGEIVDCLSNNSNVRVFGRRVYEGVRMLPFFEKQRKAYEASYMYALILHATQGGMIAVMMAFSSYFLVYLYGKGMVTVGDFALILGLSMETAHMMWYTMSEVDEFNKAIGRCKQTLQSLMMPLEIDDSPNAKKLKCSGGSIKFDNVKFHYKGSDPLFQNKSVEIKSGQKIGLVGYSGSGKTTFVNLILRMYEVTDGAILIDGQDIRGVKQDSLRESIAMIPQDPVLFQRDLLENIRYGKINATDKEVIAAAKKAHAHEFISKLPQGYKSLVGERGVKLSGGQRQRIAIARAILKNAPILILDEATSQLDSVTEGMIQQSLWSLMQNRTTLVVAHRLSTLLHMDRILVFDKGKIVEDGTHNELLAIGGLYKHLWDAQVGGFLGDEEWKG